MILYYSPGACSLVAHIALEEAGADFTATRVALANGEHRTPQYLEINPHARVPALAAEGRVITENIAILNYIAAKWQAPGSVPLGDPIAAARCNELLGWFVSSVHIGFAQVWRPERFTSDTTLYPGIVQGGHAVLFGHFREIEELVGENDFVIPQYFTAADSYLLTFFRWGRRIGADMAEYPRWADHAQRILERPSVRRALAAEDLAASDFVG